MRHGRDPTGGGASAFRPSRLLVESRRHSEAGRLWLTQVPDRTREAARLWSLEVGDRVDGGHFAHVVSCRLADQREVILRLTPDDATREVTMLRAWARADAAPTVLRHSVALGATLMVKVSSRMDLAEFLERRGAEPLLTLLRRLHTTAVPPGSQLPHARHVIAYGLARARRRVIAGTAGEVALSDVRRASTLAATLLDAAPRTVALHGDLSPGNLLETEGRLIAIDPAPSLGPPEIDAAFAALTGPWGLRSIPDRLDALSADAHLDRAALRGWASTLALERACALWHDGAGSDQAREFLAFTRNACPPGSAAGNKADR